MTTSLLTEHEANNDMHLFRATITKNDSTVQTPSLGQLLVLASLLCSMMTLNCSADRMSHGQRLSTDLPRSQSHPTLRFKADQRSQSRIQRFWLYNSGRKPLHIDEWQIKQPRRGRFDWLNAPAMPLLLQPGRAQGVQLTIKLNTTNKGEHSGTIRLFSRDAENTRNGHYDIQLLRPALPPLLKFDCQGQASHRGTRYLFAPTKPHQRRTLRCTLYNDGGSQLMVKGFRFVPEQGNSQAHTHKTPQQQRRSDFIWQHPHRFPFRLAPSHSQELRLVYQPTNKAPDTDQGHFVLHTSHDTSLPQGQRSLAIAGKTQMPSFRIVPLNPTCQRTQDCQAIAPGLECRTLHDNIKRCQSQSSQPLHLLFPRLDSGRRSTKQFLLYATGNEPLTLTQFRIDDPTDTFRFESWVSPQSLQPGQFERFSVSYRAGAAAKGNLRIESNAGVTHTLALSTHRSGCRLSSSPTSLSFQVPHSKRITLYNEGTAPCLITKLDLNGPHEHSFKIVSKAQLPLMLAPKQKFSFILRFVFVQDRNVGAYVQVHQWGLAPPLRILLKGRVMVCDCLLTIDRKFLAFGSVPVGQHKYLPVVLGNRGGPSCYVKLDKLLHLQPKLNNTFQLKYDYSKTARLSSWDSLRLFIRFAPKRPISYLSALSVHEGNKRTVLLQGHGAPPCLTLTPQPMKFRYMPTCASPLSKKITLQHTGAAGCPASLKVTKIGFWCQTDFCNAAPERVDYQLTGLPSTPLTLKRGDTHNFTLSNKNDYQPREAVLAVQTDLTRHPTLLFPIQVESPINSQRQEQFSTKTRRSWQLNWSAEVSTITVTLEERTLKRSQTRGWRYNPHTRQLSLGEEVSIGRAKTITIKYRAQCLFHSP